MLRDRNLIPLSHHHQHALALCVRLERGLKQRGDAAALAQWQAEIAQQFEAELRFHFEAEETIVFPAASRLDKLKLLVQDFMVEHRILRMYAQKAADRQLGRDGLEGFAEVLSRHVRKEERQLFEECQRLLTPPELQRIGSELQTYFQDITTIPSL
ncbi:MAG: hemerythrin domain-containing protein [Terriglobales bacterium]